jgi:hypothetical protein
MSRHSFPAKSLESFFSAGKKSFLTILLEKVGSENPEYPVSAGRHECRIPAERQTGEPEK